MDLVEGSRAAGGSPPNDGSVLDRMEVTSTHPAISQAAEIERGTPADETNIVEFTIRSKKTRDDDIERRHVKALLDTVRPAQPKHLAVRPKAATS
jgi:hypothetical protein